MATRNDIPDDFARIRLDDPPVPPAAVLAEATASNPRIDTKVNWYAPLVPPPPAPPDSLLPPDGQSLRLITGTDLMHALKYPAPAYTPRMDQGILLACSSRLAKMGLSMMPDSRCPFRVYATDQMAVFKIPDNGLPPITYRSVGFTIAYLAVLLIQNDGASEADLRLIDAWIKSATEKGRSPLPLEAFTRWLLSRRRILAKRVKTRVERQMARFVNKRRQALDLLFRLATANGEATPQRVKNLEKIFPLFGLDPGTVHAELHRFAVGQAQPLGPTATKEKPLFNPSQLAEMEHNTRQAQEMLHQIFAEPEPEPEPETAPGASSTSPMRQLLQQLAEKEAWPLQDFNSLCTAMGLVPGAALENLNDWAYEVIDEAVAEEDGEQILIDAEAANQLLDAN